MTNIRLPYFNHYKSKCKFSFEKRKCGNANEALLKK